MKALLQRVSRASVSINGGVVGSIARGLVILVGIASDDTEADAQYLVRKIAELRIFSNDISKLNLSVQDINGELLVVSQFTLMANTQKGRRPSFSEAAPPAQAKALFEHFVEQAGATGLRVATGCFQQHMQVEIHNDGPVTILLDSRHKSPFLQG